MQMLGLQLKLCCCVSVGAKKSSFRMVKHFTVASLLLLCLFDTLDAGKDLATLIKWAPEKDLQNRRFCLSGHHTNRTHCFVCPDGCTNCTENACLSCNLYTELKDGICVPSANCTMDNKAEFDKLCDTETDEKAMMFSKTTVTCVECPENCRCCRDHNRCRRCKDGYYLQWTGMQRICIPLCPKRTYFADGKCHRCPKYCDTCQKTSKAEGGRVVCTKCNSFFLLPKEIVLSQQKEFGENGTVPERWLDRCIVRCPYELHLEPDLEKMICKPQVNLKEPIRRIPAPNAAPYGTFQMGDEYLPCPALCLKCQLKTKRNSNISNPVDVMPDDIQCTQPVIKPVRSFCTEKDKNVFIGLDNSCMPCHSQCVPEYGCVGPSAEHCLACKGDRLFGACVKKCPKHTFELDSSKKRRRSFWMGNIKVCQFHERTRAGGAKKTRAYEHDATLIVVSTLLFVAHILLLIGVWLAACVFTKESTVDDEGILLNWKSEAYLREYYSNQDHNSQQTQTTLIGAEHSTVHISQVKQRLIRPTRKVKTREKTRKRNRSVLQPTQLDLDHEDECEETEEVHESGTQLSKDDTLSTKQPMTALPNTSLSKRRMANKKEQLTKRRSENTEENKKQRTQDDSSEGVDPTIAGNKDRSDMDVRGTPQTQTPANQSQRTQGSSSEISAAMKGTQTPGSTNPTNPTQKGRSASPATRQLKASSRERETNA